MNWKILVGSQPLSGRNTTHDTASLTEADVASRRAVLRGALVAGCGLLLPASLLGCSKKETSTPSSEPPVPAPETAAPASPPPMESATPSGAAPTESATPAAPAKMSQASVQYQTEPKGDQQCSNCLHFVPESNTCKLVEGDISPTGWCIIWTKMA